MVESDMPVLLLQDVMRLHYSQRIVIVDVRTHTEHRRHINDMHTTNKEKKTDEILMLIPANETSIYAFCSVHALVV